MIIHAFSWVSNIWLLNHCHCALPKHTQNVWKALVLGVGKRRRVSREVWGGEGKGWRQESTGVEKAREISQANLY